MKRLALALAPSLLAPSALAAGPSSGAPSKERRDLEIPALRPEREVPLELGPDLGVSWRPARGRARVDYKPSLTWGAHADIALNAWLGLRLVVDGTRQAVSARRGAFAAPGTDPTALLGQPELELWRLGAQLHPSYGFARRWRLWSGLGAGWTSIEAKPINGSIPDCQPLVAGAGCDVSAARRTGKLVELTTSIGLSYALVPRRVLLTASGTNAVYVSQSGSLFDEQQAFAGGRMLMLRGVPEFAGALTFAAGLGLVL